MHLKTLIDIKTPIQLNIWSLYKYLNYYKKILLFFSIIYKNEWKEHKFWRQKILKSDL